MLQKQNVSRGSARAEKTADKQVNALEEHEKEVITAT